MQVPIALSGIPRMTPKLTQIFALFRPCCNRVLDADREREATLGYRFIGGSPDQLDAMLSHEIAKWAEVAKSASLR